MEQYDIAVELQPVVHVGKVFVRVADGVDALLDSCHALHLFPPRPIVACQRLYQYQVYAIAKVSLFLFVYYSQFIVIILTIFLTPSPMCHDGDWSHLNADSYLALLGLTYQKMAGCFPFSL